MSRAFAESVIDPLLILFEVLDGDRKVDNKWSFYGTLISTLVIIFCCCTLNPVLVIGEPEQLGALRHVKRC